MPPEIQGRDSLRIDELVRFDEVDSDNLVRLREDLVQAVSSHNPPPVRLEARDLEWTRLISEAVSGARTAPKTELARVFREVSFSH